MTTKAPASAALDTTIPELPRLFALQRYVDLSGVSGTGVVAYGTCYPPTGTVTVCWLGRTTGHASIGVYESLDAVRTIHGHHGYTEIVRLSYTGGSGTGAT